MISRPGSYQTGFAPRDFPPRYPQLWNGCVGAWCASLGPTGTTLRDWSGFGQHGTLTGLTIANAWTAKQGKWANTLAGASGYISLSDYDNYTPTTTGFSAGGWMNPTNAQVVLLSKDGSGAREFGMVYGTAGIKPCCYVFDNSGGGYIGRAASADLTIGSWSHWFFTYSGGTTSASVKVFVNGIQTDNANYQGGVTFTQPRNTSQVLRIGADNWGTWYTGSVDDCRIYNRCLSPNEVALLALQRGIAYEPATKARSVGVDGGFYSRIYYDRLLMGVPLNV